MLLLPEHSLSTLDIIHHIDALSLLRGLPANSVNCVVTSPPYFGLRDYGVSGQIGLENTPQEFIGKLIAIFREVRRVLTDDGTVWVNLGDSYASGEVGRNDSVQGRRIDGKPIVKKFDERQQARPKTGLPPKSLMMIPARFAIAMQDDGWILRNEIVWSKKAPIPESVQDRFTKSHEMVYFFTKSPRYWSDMDAVKEPSVTSGKPKPMGKPYSIARNGGVPRIGGNEAVGKAFSVPFRNMRDVWHLSTQPYKGSHFAVMPQELVKRCILAGCPSGGVVLDPFMGSGTVALVAKKFGRHYIGCDLNREYVLMARQRLGQILLPMPDKVVKAKDGTEHKQASFITEMIG